MPLSSSPRRTRMPYRKVNRAAVDHFKEHPFGRDAVTNYTPGRPRPEHSGASGCPRCPGDRYSFQYCDSPDQQGIEMPWTAWTRWTASVDRDIPASVQVRARWCPALSSRLRRAPRQCVGGRASRPFPDASAGSESAPPARGRKKRPRRRTAS